MLPARRPDKSALICDEKALLVRDYILEGDDVPGSMMTVVEWFGDIGTKVNSIQPITMFIPDRD